MSPNRFEIVGLGEVLWDLLPAGRQLGGAPLNFTFHCHQLGHSAALVSRVGRDEPGQAIRSALRERGLTDSFIQEDPVHPTGTVGVEVDGQGQPTFTIHEGVAYDHLAWDEKLDDLLAHCQGLCFGSLAQRSLEARAVVRRVVASARNALVIFDVNLRQDFYTPEVLESSLRASRWVKLNDTELNTLARLFSLKGSSEPARLASLRKKFGVELVALTRGAKGCLIQTADEEVVQAGVPVRVVDTIGAGDAFTAGLLVSMLEGKTVAEAAAFANRLAARVAAAPGGTPAIRREELSGEALPGGEGTPPPNPLP